MVNFLALLGWAYDGKQEIFTLAELERLFTLEKIGANPAIFDTQKLGWVNGQQLRRLEEPERVRRVLAFLASQGHALGARGEEWGVLFVRALGERLRTLADAGEVGAFALRADVAFDPGAWAELLTRDAVGPVLDALALAIETEPDYSLARLEALTRSLAAELGVKAGELIAHARVALTGQKTSPGIFEVMWLLGREHTLARLRDAASRWSREAQRAQA